MSLLNHKLTFLTLFLAVVITILLLLARPPSASGTSLERSLSDSPGMAVTMPLTDTTYLYMPFVPVNLGPTVEIQWLHILDLEGGLQAAFLLGEGFEYTLAATNDGPFPLTISLQLSHLGPCGTTQVFNGTINLPSGASQHTFPAGGETCAGIYTATAEYSYSFQNGNLLNFFVVNPASTVVVNEQHGFDACHPPTVAEMQAWWDSSPYQVYNLYLGGSLFACDDEPLDPFWVHQVAGQGWEFILSWVGPQAPCTGFRERMSSNPAVAYQEGRAEAQLAVEAADQLGLLGDRVIYYDVEGYASATSACRSAVSSFIRGWTAELHDQGLRAGGYGGACSSYLADWASNSPPPDDVWIAHWQYSQYDPDATVWDAPCVSNNLWAGHQRIKQYAGGHNETWGDVTINIDSDVLDGEVTALPFGGRGPYGETPAATLISYGIPWQDLGRSGPSLGWVRTDARLWITADGGLNWAEISPGFSRLLDVAFLDPGQAWVVGVRGFQGDLTLAQSGDGGSSWTYTSLASAASGASPMAAAVLDIQSPDQVRVALQRASGSNFNLGEVLFTEDGGGTWRVDLGTPLTAFSAASVFGVGGDHISNPSFKLPEGVIVADFAGEARAWVIVQRGDCMGEKGAGAGITCVRSWQLLATEDAGRTWFEFNPN